MNNLEKQIVASIIGEHQLSLSDVKDLIEQVRTASTASGDFCIDAAGMEFRIIDTTAIKGIYKDTIKEIVKDCYLAGNELPSFIEVDWEATVQNCLVDGYGHTFSGYDGSELETSNFHIFRTN